MGQPVLVDVEKLVELPEGIVGELLPSVVRLQLLDSCLRSWVDTSDFVTAFARLHFPVTKDGELQQTRSVVRQGIDANVGDGKLVDQIVEGRTEVVEAVPDNQAQFVSGRRVEHFDPEEFLAAIIYRVRTKFGTGILQPKLQLPL